MTAFDFRRSLKLNRRRFLAGTAAVAALQALPVPAAAGVRAYKLKAASAPYKIDPKRPETAKTWAYNGAVPGPVLRAGQGETLRIEFTNGLDEATTVHWHGLRIPNAMDGVPHLTQPPVKPGESFVYEYVPPDAGTFWYHPHLRSTVQLGRGLYGAMVIEEPEPPKVDRDVIWAIDDWRLTEEGGIKEDFDHRFDLTHGGRLGNYVTVNGKSLREFPVKSGERLRLRLLNAANARSFGLNFGPLSATVIALDGQPVTPFQPPSNRVTLGSGQRADVIVDMTGKPGERITVVDDHFEKDLFDFVTFVHAPGKPLRESPLDAPVALRPNPVPEPDLGSAIAQEVVIQGGAMGGLTEAKFQGEVWKIRKLFRKHRKVWTLNGVAFADVKTPPMFTLKRDASYKWTIKNDTVWEHPMHLHGHHFRLLTRNGKAVTPKPLLDTVLLAPDEPVEVAFVADNPGDWLFHCHILEHHLAGMGSVVRVG